MSLTSHQRPHRGATDVWLTPPEIIAALGPFDLDPCAAVDQPWPTARTHYTEVDDGLSRPWFGMVWCNPPFGPAAGTWLARCAEHGNALALCPARTETRWFFDSVWDQATSVLFMRGRPHFHHSDGRRGSANSGAPIALVAYGDRAAHRLRHSGIRGALLVGWSTR